jgi:hypothetical protein
MPVGLGLCCSSSSVPFFGRDDADQFRNHQAVLLFGGVLGAGITLVGMENFLVRFDDRTF